jgi:acid stress-induced BolA-like protein IbaG/YrbA
MNASPMTPERVADLIRAGLPGATVRVESDDNTHFASQIVALQFAGLRPIARHQLVPRRLGRCGTRDTAFQSRRDPGCAREAASARPIN